MNILQKVNKRSDEETLAVSESNLHDLLLKLVPYRVAKQFVIFPVDLRENYITIFHYDPQNIMIGDCLREFIGYDYQINIVYKSEEYIRKKIDEFYLIKTLDSHPINEIVERAVLMDSSDIHIVPCENQYNLLLRIDGELIPQEQLEIQQAERLISALKLKARLNVAESRKPQSGSFAETFFNRKIDFRISTHPTIYGETLNVRILDPHKNLLLLNNLGFPADIESNLNDLIQMKQGMIILTGPTGSGKTTTLYALLNMLAKKNLNIMTIEDPVEYKIPGIRQSEINPYKDLDYSAGIKSILRQDPDVILIGEIRDEETAKMAFRAAITGHLVLTTLHTNDAIGALQRLRDLGVENNFIADSLSAIVAQRLVKKLCDVCKVPTIGRHYVAGKCNTCGHTGYKGRTNISELLMVNDSLRTLILSNVDETQIKSSPDLCYSKLERDAFIKFDSGISSYDELKPYLGDHEIITL